MLGVADDGRHAGTEAFDFFLGDGFDIETLDIVLAIGLGGTPSGVACHRLDFTDIASVGLLAESGDVHFDGGAAVDVLKKVFAHGECHPRVAHVEDGNHRGASADEVAHLGIDLDDFASGRVRGDRENPLAAVFADSGEAATARELVFPVFARAAVLSAAQLAAFAVKSESGRDPARPVAICADGSTYYKTRTVSFPDIVRMELDRLLTSARGIHYEILPQIDDAPMVGAAIVALQTA